MLVPPARRSRSCWFGSLWMHSAPASMRRRRRPLASCCDWWMAHARSLAIGWDWSEGGALWKCAKESTGSDEKTGELTDAIAQHAYRKHWGHTVLGLLACRCGESNTAVSHLIASADVRPDYRRRRT